MLEIFEIKNPQHDYYFINYRIGANYFLFRGATLICAFENLNP